MNSAAGPASHIPAATSASYPARIGNLVRPLVGGTPIFRTIGEAIEGARHSIWLTVAFYVEDFRFPDGRGALFDVLDRAVARGLDVRVLFWRPNPESSGYGRTFPGSPANRELLARRGSHFRIRWDRAAAAFCQHQKSWVIDAGRSSETAFVGGANLTEAALQRHDVYVEVTGPSATDVHGNFVQRWNEASERKETDGNWACDAEDTLPFPAHASEPQGASTVQIQRMFTGERSILEQYERAIDAARRTIYLENQAIPIPQVANRLVRALERGVEVGFLVPASPEDHVYAARRDLRRRALFDGLQALGRHPNFLLAGIARREVQQRRPVYVHAKLMIVDDMWATIGSCNLHAYSLSGHAEMNASIWDASVVRELRRTLFAMHLGVDTVQLDDRAALELYRRIAHENRRKLERDDPDWQGLAFALAPEAYGRKMG